MLMATYRDIQFLYNDVDTIKICSKGSDMLVHVRDLEVLSGRIVSPDYEIAFGAVSKYQDEFLKQMVNYQNNKSVDKILVSFEGEH